ncbi:MAG: hypothetical protein IJT83_00020 [Victivallales bacterium]|nr:hypothetical protein [Victivallales bacterium]
MLEEQVVVEGLQTGLNTAKEANKPIEFSDVVLPDGRRVYNAWCAEEGYRFRTEIEVAADGNSVEITTKTEVPAYHVTQANPPQLSISLPKSLIGESANYAGYIHSSRTKAKTEGVLSKDNPLPKYAWRFFTLKTEKYELSFDCHPIGAGDFCNMADSGVIRGLAAIQEDENGIKISFANLLGWFGGMTAAKLRIKIGGMENFDKDHALTDFRYNEPLRPMRLLSFGAEKHGDDYLSANEASFQPEKGYGWVSTGKLIKTTTTPGAYYSHFSGKDGVYRLSGLKDGLHLITIGAGNPDGMSNHFSCYVNRQPFFLDVSIDKGEMLTATLPLWVDDGTVDIAFEGDFILSCIGDQFLLSNREDYQCRRGFWCVDGYEPSVLYRNSEYLPRALAFSPQGWVGELPVPGQETAAPLKDYRSTPKGLDYSDPANQWLFKIKFLKVGNNPASLHELASPEAMERFMAEAVQKGRNTLMLSGLHSRHTYPNSDERVFEYIRNLCEAAHRHGLKVIEHHDTTLLWNTDAGFRRLAERIGEVNRSIATQLPGVQLCAFNPQFLKTYTEYLSNIVRCGVDGLQIDELGPFSHACSCEHCRRLFTQETGWQIPVDESEKWQQDFQRDITRVWTDWKLEHNRKIKGELIAEMRKINPHLALFGYGVLRNLVSQAGPRHWNTDMTSIGQITSMFGHEALASDPIMSARMFVPGQKLFNFFRYNNGIPIFTWLYTRNWFSSYFGYAVCNMNAQLPVFFAHGTESMPEKAPDFLKFDASKENMDITKAAPIAQVALLLAAQTRNWENDFSPANALFGCAQTLEELHIPYQVIGEDTLAKPEKMRPFKVLYLGMASCLSDEQMEHIRQFASNGGTVLLESKTATRDKWGRSRKEWPLADVFGFSLVEGNANQTTATSVIMAGGTFTFGKPIICNWGNTDGSSSVVGGNDDGLSSKKLARFSAWHIQDKGGTLKPLLYQQPHGRGTFVYLPITLSRQVYYEAFTDNYNKSYEYDAAAAEVYRTVLLSVLGDAANLVRTDAPEKVFLTLYRQDKAVFLHLLNGMGTGNAEIARNVSEKPKEAFPPMPHDLLFTLNVGAVKAAYAVSPDFEGCIPLPLIPNNDGKISFVLPKERLKIYTIVRLE